MTRAPKKRETLENSLPYFTKTAFIARCRQDGVTASQALRADIDARLARKVAPGWTRVRAIAGAAEAVPTRIFRSHQAGA